MTCARRSTYNSFGRAPCIDFTWPQGSDMYTGVDREREETDSAASDIRFRRRVSLGPNRDEGCSR